MRLAVFALSAPVTALAGWLHAYRRAYVGPDLFESYSLVLVLTAAVVVGKRRLLGPSLGQERFFSFGGHVDAIVLGGALVAVLAFFPDGLVGARALIFRRREDFMGRRGRPLSLRFWCCPSLSCPSPCSSTGTSIRAVPTNPAPMAVWV